MPPRSGGGAEAPLCTRRCPTANFRCGNTSQSWLRHDSSPQGEPALSGEAAQSLSLRRGGTRSVTERCAAAQRRRRGSALCTRRKPAENFRCGNTSQSWLRHDSSPQGEPSLSGEAAQSLSLRRGPQGSAASGGRSDRSGWAATCLGGPQRGPGRLSGNPVAREA